MDNRNLSVEEKRFIPWSTTAPLRHTRLIPVSSIASSAACYERPTMDNVHRNAPEASYAREKPALSSLFKKVAFALNRIKAQPEREATQ